MFNFWVGLVIGGIVAASIVTSERRSVAKSDLARARRLYERVAYPPLVPMRSWAHHRPWIRRLVAGYRWRATNRVLLAWIAIAGLLAAFVVRSLREHRIVSEAGFDASASWLIFNGLSSLGLGTFVGFAGTIFFWRLLLNSRGAPDLTTAGAVGLSILAATFLARDPNLTALNNFKASFSGVSIDIAKPAVENSSFDPSSGAFHIGKGDYQGPLARIEYGLALLRDWDRMIGRDLDYAKSMTFVTTQNDADGHKRAEEYNSKFDELRDSLAVDRYFATKILMPTAARLKKLHDVRRSRDIWWVTDRSFVNSVINISTGTSQAADGRAFASGIANIWSQICSFERSEGSEEICTEDANKVATAWQRLPAFGTMDLQYTGLVGAVTLLMADEQEAAAMHLHALIVRRPTPNKLASSPATALELILQYRTHVIYSTLLQYALSSAKMSDGVEAITLHRTLESTASLGGRILSFGKWKELNGGAEAQLSAHRRTGRCSAAVPREVKKFLTAHLGILNNLVHSGAASYGYVKEVQANARLSAIAGTLRAFPYECLVEDETSKLQSNGLRAASRDTVAAWHRQVAGDPSQGESTRKFAACSSSRLYREAATYRTVELKQKSAALFPLKSRHEDGGELDLAQDISEVVLANSKLTAAQILVDRLGAGPC